MSLLINGAGGSSSDPILTGLGLEPVVDASSVDLSALTNVWIDQAAGFPGTNSQSASLSPASGVTTQGTGAAVTTGGVLSALSSTTGLSVGDYIYITGSSPGVYKILSVDSATQVTLSGYGGAAHV